MTIKKLPPFDLKVGYEWMEPETVMGGEFAESQYWLNDAKGPIEEASLLSTTRASDIVLPDSAGVFQTLDNNALPRTDRGLYANGQLPVLNRSSGDFRVSPPANTGWNRSGASSYENKVSIFEGSIACQLQGGGQGSEAFTSNNILGLTGSYIFEVIIERGTNTLSSFGVGRNAPSFAWVGLAQYNWNTNSITTGAGTLISTRVTDLGMGPNGGALRRLSLEVNITEGTAWGLYIYASGSGANTNSAIVHYGALYPGNIYSDALFLSPVGSSGTLFASDIRAVQGVRPSNSQPEPFPGWEAAGLDEKYKMTARVNIDRLNSSVAHTIAAIGANARHKMHVYLDTDNRIKAAVERNPSVMFAEGQPGIFLDGSDNSVMWQDAAGTTPVTALGQPVGLILDKRLWGGKTYAEVMAAQPELVTNGDFENGSAGWQTNSGQSISGGQAIFDGSNSSGYVRQYNVLTEGRSYLVTLDVASVSVGGVRLMAGPGAWATGMGPTVTLPGVHTFIVHPVMSGLLYMYGDVGPFAGAINSISVREIPGNHAYQTTAASARPVWQENDLGARGLLFDGVNDNLVTPSIDFSASDKILVAAGVRKLSDASTAVVAELTASVSSNDGSMFLAAPPNYGASSFGFASRGTSTAGATRVDAAYAAPVSSVLTGLGDIGADIARLRVNGQQVAENIGDQGTGNYSNAALYIGCRGGASLPFNGFLHQLVIRGGAWPDAAELEQLESYLADKNNGSVSNEIVGQSDPITVLDEYEIELDAVPGAYALAVTGAGGSTSTSNVPLPTGATTLRIGSDIDGTNPYNGWIKNVQVVTVE